MSTKRKNSIQSELVNTSKTRARLGTATHENIAELTDSTDSIDDNNTFAAPSLEEYETTE